MAHLANVLLRYGRKMPLGSVSAVALSRWSYIPTKFTIDKEEKNSVPKNLVVNTRCPFIGGPGFTGSTVLIYLKNP